MRCSDSVVIRLRGVHEEFLSQVWVTNRPGKSPEQMRICRMYRGSGEVARRTIPEGKLHINYPTRCINTHGIVFVTCFSIFAVCHSHRTPDRNTLAARHHLRGFVRAHSHCPCML